MKLKPQILPSILILSFLAIAYNNCSDVKFKGDPSVALDQLKTEDIIVGNPMTQSTKTLVAGICETLTKCRPNLSVAQCEDGVLKTSGIDYQIGLQKASFSSLSGVLQSEKSGLLTGNLAATSSCVYSLMKLSCDDPSVQKAYDSAAQDPFLGVAYMIPTSPGSCPAIFNQPVRNEYYVSPTGSDTNDGSVAKPWATITHASNALQLGPAGAIVHVAPGTYTPKNISACYIGNGPNCAIKTTRSGSAEAPITYISDVQGGAKIQSSGAYALWYNTGSHVRISGFEMIGDAATNVGIINLAAFTEITGNHIHHIPVSAACANGNGGGGIVHGNTAEVHENNTSGNRIHDIGPVLPDGLANSSYCTEAHGISYRQPGGKIQNNIIYRISSWGVMTWRAASNLQISNNLIFASGSKDGGGALIGGGLLIGASPSSAAHDNTTVANNIFRNNSGNSIVESGQTGTNNVYLNNVVFSNGKAITLQNGLTASGTLTSDPQMINFQRDGSGDYKLQASSPGIDAGTSNCAQATGQGNCTPNTDTSGVLRPIGAAIDIGPFEYRP